MYKVVTLLKSRIYFSSRVPLGLLSMVNGLGHDLNIYSFHSTLPGFGFVLKLPIYATFIGDIQLA